MSTSAEIRAALKKQGPMSVTELAQHCTGVDRQQVASMVAELRMEGKIKGFGYDSANKPVYAIDHWPEGEVEPGPGAAPASERQPEPASAAPTPPPAVHHEEEVMDKKPLAERVVEALRHGPLNLDDLAKKAGTTKGTLYTMMGTFQKKHGVVKVSRGVYGLGSARQAPPNDKSKKLEREPSPKRVVKKKKAKLRARSDRPARRAAPPAPPAPNGEGPHFAINEHGELGIETDDQKVKLAPAAFSRLRDFIERTKPIWDGASA